MTWNYVETNLDKATASGRINIVRLLVGDKDSSDKQVSDEEITFALSEIANNNVYYASSWLALSLSSKYSRKVDTELDGAIKISYSTLAAHYRTLSLTLEHKGRSLSSAVGVSAGGLTKSSLKDTTDSDRAKGAFSRDQFSNPPTNYE